MTSLGLGVDLGGTKIEAVVVEISDAASNPIRELARVRAPTERDGGYDHVLANVARVIADVTRDAGLAAPPPIGVGMPGSTTHRLADGTRSPAALVKNSNTTCLNGRPFHDDLRAKVGGASGASIVFANDADCFALAEATLGASRGARVSFGVILGTGVGGGVVFAGDGERPRVWSGAQGIAGEWGHVVLEPSSGPRCYCGRRGCVEQYLSGPAIEAAYAARSGERRTVAEIASRRGVDAAARATCDAVLDAFGRAMATVIDVLDPEVVVLGGGVSNLDLFYDEGLVAVGRWIFNDEVRTRIVRHAIGDSAGVLGAAFLTRNEA